MRKKITGLPELFDILLERERVSNNGSLKKL
jgi:hypothetical protein